MNDFPPCLSCLNWGTELVLALRISDNVGNKIRDVCDASSCCAYTRAGAEWVIWKPIETFISSSKNTVHLPLLLISFPLGNLGSKTAQPKIIDMIASEHLNHDVVCMVQMNTKMD